MGSQTAADRESVGQTFQSVQLPGVKKVARGNAFRAPPRELHCSPLTAYCLLPLRCSFLRYRSRLTSYPEPAAIPLHPRVHTPVLVSVFLTFIQPFLHR